MSPAVARRSAPVTGLALGLAVIASAALAVGADARASEPEAPTVVFTRGSPPRACSSAPIVTSLTVPEGTELVLANDTGHDAAPFVGNVQVVPPVEDGDGAGLTLDVGQHEVRMVACQRFGRAEPLTVTVMASGPSGGTEATVPPTTPGGSGLSGPPAPAPAPAAAAPTRGGGTGSLATTDEPALVPAASTTDPPDAPAADAAAASTAPPRVAGVISARPVDLVGEGPSKGLRLLAAVATICVLGVTVAIIRVIVRLSP